MGSAGSKFSCTAVFWYLNRTGNYGLFFYMKPLNRFIVTKTSKMATGKMVACSFHPGDFVASLELSDAYFHVHNDPAFHHFLHFQFQFPSFTNSA